MNEPTVEDYKQALHRLRNTRRVTIGDSSGLPEIEVERYGDQVTIRDEYGYVVLSADMLRRAAEWVGGKAENDALRAELAAMHEKFGRAWEMIQRQNEMLVEPPKAWVDEVNFLRTQLADMTASNFAFERGMSAISELQKARIAELEKELAAMRGKLAAEWVASDRTPDPVRMTGPDTGAA